MLFSSDRGLTHSPAPPRVAQFEFPSDARQGSRISVVCLTRSGQPPFHFHWSKNGQPLSREDRITMSSTEDASVLTFRQLRTEDVGNYTCHVKNIEGTDGFTAFLRMKSEFEEIAL